MHQPEIWIILVVTAFLGCGGGSFEKIGNLQNLGASRGVNIGKEPYLTTFQEFRAKSQICGSQDSDRILDSE